MLSYTRPVVKLESIKLSIFWTNKKRTFKAYLSYETNWKIWILSILATSWSGLLLLSILKIPNLAKVIVWKWLSQSLKKKKCWGTISGWYLLTSKKKILESPSRLLSSRLFPNGKLCNVNIAWLVCVICFLYILKRVHNYIFRQVL